MLVLFTHVSLLVWLDCVFYAALRTLCAVFLQSQTGSWRGLLTYLLPNRKLTGLILTRKRVFWLHYLKGTDHWGHNDYRVEKFLNVRYMYRLCIFVLICLARFMDQGFTL